MSDRAPDFVCTACGVDMYLFPTGSDWNAVREGYRRCGLDVPTPHCGQCVIDGVKAGAFVDAPQGHA